MRDGILEALRGHLNDRSERIAYRFLETGDADGAVVEWTYGRLDAEVSAVAATLREQLSEGSRVLLLFPPGIDFVAGFLGCLRAGMVAVPAYLPSAEQQWPRALGRMRKVVEDCSAAAVLTMPGAAAASLEAVDPALGALGWLTRGPLGPVVADAPGPIAFLQYTSGSTGVAKGVVVSHANLVHNLRSQYAAWRLDQPQAVSWLPAYHDMGLIGTILHPLYLGGTATLMAPEAFLARPSRWLTAISRFGGTLSAAPNFGYELCVRKIGDADLAGVDLSSWKVAVNGAEPVRAGTLRSFAERFAAVGFDPAALVPSYGLAEATLLVTAAPRGAWAATGSVACGQPTLDTRVVIVEPDTATPVEPSGVGEIWVESDSNALGYWNRPVDTMETFAAQLADGSGPFLRTGDVGEMTDEGLHIRGRIKDLVIVDGVNHYPQDIEQTVERCHPAVRPGCVAAFGVEVDGAERLVIAAETVALVDGLRSAVGAAVMREHQLAVYDVLQLPSRSLPKTSSGKLQRRETAARYLDGTLARHDSPSSTLVRTGPSIDVIRDRLVAHMAVVLDRPRSEIPMTAPFSSFGLVSRDTVALAAELSEWLHRGVEASDVYAHPTVEALARFLSGANAPGADSFGGSVVPAATELDDAIAVVGIGCRFPGADGPDAFWRLLRDGVDAIQDVPPDRWDVDEFYQPGGSAPGRMYTRRGGFIGDVAGFDPAFFGMSDSEARYLDPQQRLLLETAWAAMEDAGAIPESLAGSLTGVYIGLTTGDYAHLMAAAGMGPGPYAATGNVACMAANRISYTFDLRGPSLTIDTACSSSLVAIHHACAAIRSGEIEAAIAGGANLMLSPATTVALCQSGALSPDGRCFTFDDRANGYVRGEGIGLVLLKPLAQARADSDRVYAVIRGSAVNQDGRSNGLGAPNPEAHARVIRQAYRNAGLDPSVMQYVEAHGTGTGLGDPIEARAIGSVARDVLPTGALCAIGSVKTNIGHLEPAAGAAGLIKVALALHHRQLPPSLHHANTNPHIDTDGLRLRVQDTLEPWDSEGAPRVGGVNSFGVGGTNAHAVLQEAERPAPVVDDGEAQLLVLSGRTPAAVADLVHRFADFLPGTSATLTEICGTAALRRAQHEHRYAAVASSVPQLVEILALGIGGGVVGQAPPGADSRIVFVFPGQGAQYEGMARTMYGTDPAFRAAFDECARHMGPYLDWSPREALHADGPASRMGEEVVVQPLLFAIQVALAAAWAERGVRPDAVVGHSMGEVAAAYVAGALTLAEAAELTCVRARLLSEVVAAQEEPGAMAVVALHHSIVRGELLRYDGRLHLAAANGPTLSVVAGDADVVDAYAADVQARGVFVRRIRARGAGHSPAVTPAADEIARRFAGLTPRKAQIPLYSSVTGDRIEGEQLRGVYWARNLRSTVLFHQAVERLAADGYRLLVEMSPHPTLVVPVQEALDELIPGGRAVGSLMRDKDDRVSILEAFGALYTAGGAVELREVAKAAPVTSLPTAPWQRRRCWFTGVEDDGTGATVDVTQAVADAFAGVLRVADVPADASFFELGGTSLMAAQMLYDLRTRLDRDIPLRTLFAHPTARGLALALETASSTASAALPPLTRSEADDFPLSFNQERVLNLDSKRYPRVVAQHLLLDGRVDEDALQAALDRCLEIHEGLRSGLFQSEPSGVRQALRHAPRARLAVRDLTGHADPEAALYATLRQTEQPFQPFDEPMYRFNLVRLADERQVFSVAADHLVCDGWSLGVLLMDAIQAYEAGPEAVEAPRLRFGDFATWEREVYAGPKLAERMKFWRAKLDGLRAPQPWFMAGRDVDVEEELRPRVVEVEISGPQLRNWEEFAGSAASTMPMVVITGLLLALRAHCGQDDLAIPMTASGRERPELQRVIGWLAQTHLLAVDFGGRPTRRECLARVREALLTAEEEQGLGLSHYAYVADLPNSAVPFRVGVNYLPDIAIPARLGSAAVTPLPRPSEDKNLTRDLSVFVRPGADSLRIYLAYAVDIVKEDGVNTFATDLVAAVDDLTTRPDVPIDALPHPND